MMKKLKYTMMVVFCLLSILAVQSLFAAGKTEVNEEAAGAATVEDLKVAVIFLGPVSDGGYNSVAYKGLVKIEEQLGAQIAFAEVSFADVERTMSNYARQGYDIVFAHSGSMQEAAKTVAPEFPDTRYVLLAGKADGIDNLTAIDFKRSDIGYLAGAMAGTLTKSNKVGYILGMDFPSMRLMEEGFKSGVKEMNPEADVITAFLGTFNDVIKGKEAALSQISQGADVLAHNAGWGALGMFEAAKEKNVMAIGYPSDQNSLAIQNVVSSIDLKFDELLPQTVEKYINGELEPGTEVKTIANGGIKLAPFYGMISAEQKQKIENLISKIKSGEITIE